MQTLKSRAGLIREVIDSRSNSAASVNSVIFLIAANASRGARLTVNKCPNRYMLHYHRGRNRPIPRPNCTIFRGSHSLTFSRSTTYERKREPQKIRPFLPDASISLEVTRLTMAGPTLNPYRFGGQAGYRRDSPRRQYVQARFLDTDGGRWLSRDHLGLAGRDGNLYRYAGDDPVNSSDVSSLAASRHGRKPKHSCPPGYSQVTVTAYGDCAGCRCGHCDIAYPKQCGCDKGRQPQAGDCAIDQHNKVCQPGQYIIIIKKDGTKTSCRACDAGQGHGGIDIKVPGPDTVHNVSQSWDTGKYCVSCSDTKP